VEIQHSITETYNVHLYFGEPAYPTLLLNDKSTKFGDQTFRCSAIISTSLLFVSQDIQVLRYIFHSEKMYLTCSMRVEERVRGRISPKRAHACTVHSRRLPKVIANGNGRIEPIEVTLRAATPVCLPLALSLALHAWYDQCNSNLLLFHHAHFVQGVV
jgi:hypothetical protein